MLTHNELHPGQRPKRCQNRPRVLLLDHRPSLLGRLPLLTTSPARVRPELPGVKQTPIMRP